MTQNTNWFVTEENRAKAKIKYELNHLEALLNSHFKAHVSLQQCPEVIRNLCIELAHKYDAYLKCVDRKIKLNPQIEDNELTWVSKLTRIFDLKNQLMKAAASDDKISLMQQIAALYHQFINPAIDSTNGPKVNDQFSKLVHIQDLKEWLTAVVDFCNQRSIDDIDFATYFRGCSVQQGQAVLFSFAQVELVNLVNAIFFYKLYPDKLYSELMHPEKLVSVRMRVGVIHQFIEQLHAQLHNAAKQQGLKPGIDHLFHGNELPQGIMLEVNEEYRDMIQLAVKNLKIQFNQENELQIALERLHDLAYAYKFWFNPNRLIDAAMVLQQRLVKKKTAVEDHLELFKQEMSLLYSNLTTTECLNLYGYFANNDSSYLLYTLYSIAQGQKLDWLPELDAHERNAINDVFNALQAVMEALRITLKARHVNTQPYVYDLAKEQIKAGRRNREAVFRIVAIYAHKSVTMNESIEKLFSFVEEQA